MPKDTSKSDPEAYMKFYPDSNRPVSPEVQARIRKDRYLAASWQRVYIADQERKRAEDSGDWTLRLPRELMDIILSDPVLGVREHLALAATSPELRRLYHNSHIWTTITRTRTIPVNGVQVFFESKRSGPISKEKMPHLATAPQKKKPNGPYFKPLVERYSVHNVAVRDICSHRISRARVADLYSNLTDEHLTRSRFYEAVTHRYPNQRKKAGYAEVAVEWLSIRVANGMA